MFARCSNVISQRYCTCVQEEWVNDSQGLPAMPFIVFYQAVFELIGVRCVRIVCYLEVCGIQTACGLRCVKYT